MLKGTRSGDVLDTCYKNGLLAVLLRYLEENCDIITNYDYILSLLSLLSSIPLPSPPLSLSSTVLSEYTHCGDPGMLYCFSFHPRHRGLRCGSGRPLEVGCFLHQTRHCILAENAQRVGLRVVNLLGQIDDLLVLEEEIRVLRCLGKEETLLSIVLGRRSPHI